MAASQQRVTAGAVHFAVQNCRALNTSHLVSSLSQVLVQHRCGLCLQHLHLSNGISQASRVQPCLVVAPHSIVLHAQRRGRKSDFSKVHYLKAPAMLGKRQCLQFCSRFQNQVSYAKPHPLPKRTVLPFLASTSSFAGILFAVATAFAHTRNVT